MKPNNSTIIGITGGTGCGQTTLAKFLEEQGAKIIYADSIAHRIADSDAGVRKQLSKAFGRQIYTRYGKLKRKVLGKIVFNDENRLRLLNRIVHPPMVGQIVEDIEKARESGSYPIIGVDAALIFEANIEKMFDAIVVVVSKMNNRVQRIKNRDELPQKKIMERIRMQIPVDEKSKWADFVIQNDDDIGSLKNKAKALYKQLCGRERQAPKTHAGNSRKPIKRPTSYKKK
jgi:dephospho-CoA kinase